MVPRRNGLRVRGKKKERHMAAQTGSSEQVATQVAALFEAGATRVEFGTPHGLTAAHGIELLGRRVLPAVLG